MKTTLTILFLVIPVMLIYSQALTDNITEKAPKGFQAGHVVLNDSTKLEGYIIRKA